jgi:transcriptional regulator with XRE-family HTH domain
MSNNKFHIMWREFLLTEFGKRVREERVKTGLTQEEFGRIAGVHRTYIGAVERGEVNLTLTNLKKIVRALNVKASKLLEDL